MVSLSSASGVPMGGGGEGGVFTEFQPPLNSALLVLYITGCVFYCLCFPVLTFNSLQGSKPLQGFIP